MSKLKNSLIIAAYVLLVAVFFIGGYALGINKEDYADEAVSVSVNETQEEKTKTVNYLLTIEDGMLIIYSVNGDEKSIVTSEPISENVFPKEDMDELKSGVYFDDINQAQAMFENFVS